MVLNEGAGVTYSVSSNTHLIIIIMKSCERRWIQCKNGRRFVQVALLSEIRQNQTNTELKRSLQLQWNDKWNHMVFFSVSAVSPTLGMLPACHYCSRAKESKHQWHEPWSTTSSERKSNKVLWAGLFPNKANALHLWIHISRPAAVTVSAALPRLFVRVLRVCSGLCYSFLLCI